MEEGDELYENEIKGTIGFVEGGGGVTEDDRHV